MAITALKLKIMPEQGENLEVLKKNLEISLTQAGAVKINSMIEEPIAFGLKAIIITLAWPENKETGEAEEAAKIEGVSSVEIIDYRRAFG